MATMYEIYFGKYRQRDGKYFYACVTDPGSRKEAMRNLRVYNHQGSRLVGCRKRILILDQYRALINGINDRGPDIRGKLFDER